MKTMFSALVRWKPLLTTFLNANLHMRVETLLSMGRENRTSANKLQDAYLAKYMKHKCGGENIVGCCGVVTLEAKKCNFV